MAKPSVFPTGVTIYNKDKTENGYTLFQSGYGATLIDMNGRMVKIWQGVANPIKPLPGGQIMATQGMIPGSPGASSQIRLIQIDWDGKVVWNFNNNLEVVDREGKKQMGARVHHDFEKEGAPVSYYAPNNDYTREKGNTLILTHNPVCDERISDKPLMDERIIEVDHDGAIIWEWKSHEHFEEFGLDQVAREALYNYPMMDGDWIHLNAISTLGENAHYAAGDERFHPNNILASSRQLNTMFIIEKSTGKIVWRVGPDYLATPELRKLGQIIGQHHVHMIQKGLPGEGNILVFDNGSFGGYGAPNGTAPIGTDAVRRHYSRVVEFDPVTLEVKWEYMKAQRNAEDVNEMNASEFFSAYISSAQRLVNGNTLITQGADGIVIEVTPEKEIVWEFVNPIRNVFMPPLMQNSIYRAYRVPYEWVPQVERPEEISVVPPANEQFLVPGSFPIGDKDACATQVKF